MLGPTRVIVPTRDLHNGVLQLEASESLEPVRARVDTPRREFWLNSASERCIRDRDLAIARSGCRRVLRVFAEQIDTAREVIVLFPYVQPVIMPKGS